jgi:dsRNA-specific ribonuclease
MYYINQTGRRLYYFEPFVPTICSNFKLPFQVIEAKGPTNTRVYTVAVYFRGERLAKAEGHSIQQAEMAAAKLALEECGHLVRFT